MVLWAVVGDVGSGKTIFTVELAKQLHKFIPIFSNITIKYPNCSLINPEDLINMQYKKAMIVLDEGYTWLESRTSSSKLNIYCDYVIFQSRKRGLDIILTAQLLSTIDVRFRNLYNVMVICQNREDGFYYTLVKKSLFGLKFCSMTLPLKIAETLYDKYDSYDIVKPFGLEKTSQEISILTNPDKANKLIDEITEKARDELNLVTHATVQDYMLQNNYNLNLSSFVYARLKRLQQNSKK